MIRRPPRSTRTDTRFPYTTLFRSSPSGNGGRARDLPRRSTPCVRPLRMLEPSTRTRPPLWRDRFLDRSCGVSCQPVDEHILPKERSEEHTSELQSLMRISYAVFCLKKKQKNIIKRIL